MATVRDCVYGQAVGDALGVPYEGLARDAFACAGMVGFGAHRKPVGTWSDDTSLALALCDSIRACGRIDCADVRARFLSWFNEGAYTVDGTFGVGNTTARALIEGAGRAGERDNGNGSLMRTVPLAFTEATDEQVRAVSAITHAHPLSTEACVEAVLFARLLAAGAGPREAAGAVWEEDVAAAPREAVPSGGFVRDTLRAAVWCLLTTGTFAECVLSAVNLGGDTDTTAAVAGAFAGIVYGARGIPAEWLATLRGKDIIERCLF